MNKRKYLQKIEETAEYLFYYLDERREWVAENVLCEYALTLTREFDLAFDTIREHIHCMISRKWGKAAERR